MDVSFRDNIGYWLFYVQRGVAHAFSESLKACCVEHGKPYVITPPQLGVIAELYEHDGRAVGDVSQGQGVDAPTVTGIVTRLQQNGLVQRVHDQEDRRVVKIYLTDEGRNFFPLLNRARIVFLERLLQGFSTEEERDLRQMLYRLLANVTDSEAETGDRFRLLPKNMEERSQEPIRKEDQQL